MKKILLLVLLILPIFTDFAFSQQDTVWIANRKCTYDHFEVSPDERFVIAWGWNNYDDQFDPIAYKNKVRSFGKVFNAQTGEWLKDFVDTTYADPYDGNLIDVEFDPDSSKMMLSFMHYNLLIDLNNNFEILDTLPQGSPRYSQDGRYYAYSPAKIFDANTNEIVFNYEFPEEEGYDIWYSYGIFLENNTKFKISYKKIPTDQFHYEQQGIYVINLIDSTHRRYHGMYTPFYHRPGSDKYVMFEPRSVGEQYDKIKIRYVANDSLVNPNLVLNTSELCQISHDGQYYVYGTYFNKVSDGTLVCNGDLFEPTKLGNNYIITPYKANGNVGGSIMAVRTCISYLGVPPPAIEQEIKTYPVPTKDKLNIEMELLGGDYKAEIVDVMGRRLSELSLGYLTNGHQTIYLETVELPSGLYQVIIRSSSEVRAAKFVKG